MDQPDQITRDVLAIDVGLRFGLARVEATTGRILWQRSQHVSDRAALKRYAWGLLNSPECLGVGALVAEGGGDLAAVWSRTCQRRDLPIQLVNAELWRAELLYHREQTSGRVAKDIAVQLATRVLDWSDARPASPINNDAAEAVLLGIWYAWRQGWLANPDEIFR